MAKKRKKGIKFAQSQKASRGVGSHGTSSASARQKRPTSLAPQSTSANPFEAADDILLVGEGDFSFAVSLMLHHSTRFTALTATSFETREQLLSKYPQAERNTELLASSAGADIASNFPHASSAGIESPASASQSNLGARQGNCKVLYSVDAKRLSSHPRLKRRRFSKIAFNFPHVGGKSTDVNRQVRYNQELVHGFLHSCKALLANNGSILVTLFEGEPYSLWNVRDLARSVGLIVKRSFSFDARIYPGYRHARTLGNLKGTNVDDDDMDGTEEPSKKKSGWRGENRSAKTYEFGLENSPPQGSKRKRKRVQDDDDLSSSED